jgi:hypothetical protein
VGYLSMILILPKGDETFHDVQPLSRYSQSSLSKFSSNTVTYRFTDCKDIDIIKPA